jgi:hypothetical protein
MTTLRLTEDDLAIIDNALRIAATACERDAESPCATQAEAFRESAAAYRKLGERLEDADRIVFSGD